MFSKKLLDAMNEQMKNEFLSAYLYLAMAGYFDEAELDTFLQPLSKLNGHPDRNKVPGVETNTGPLGHGFPVWLLARPRWARSRKVPICCRWKSPAA